MAAPFSMESRSLLRLLEDGEWHDLEDIHARLAATVAPGKALRRYEDRAAHRAAKEGPRRTSELSDEDKIHSGQRILAGVAINSMKKRYVEIVETSCGKRIRRRPGVDVELPPKLDTGDGDEGQAPELVPPETVDGAVRSLGTAGQPAVEPVEVAQPPQPEPWDTCLSCGLYVVNKAQHAEFHALHDAGLGERAPVAAAFFSEEQVRAIVAGEVDKALDAFQKGMQSWLIHRFAAMETLVQGRYRNPLGLDQRPLHGRW